MSQQTNGPAPRQPYDRLNTSIAELLTAKSQTDLFQCMCDLGRDSTDAVGVALLSKHQGNVGVVATSPPVEKGEVPWLATLAKPFAQIFTHTIQCIRLESSEQSAYGLYVPLFSSDSGSLYLAAFVYGSRSIRLQSVVDMLQLVKTTVLLIDKVRDSKAGDNFNASEDGGSLLTVVDTIGEVQRTTRFFEAATTLCTSLASSFHCRRVGLGIMRKSSVKLLAVDQMENFSRGTHSVRMIEEAMQEAAGQSSSILYSQNNEQLTPDENAAPLVTRATAELATVAGVQHILTIPLGSEGANQFVLLLQIDRPEVLPEQVSALHLIGTLVAPTLQQLHAAEELPLKKLWRYISTRSEDIFGPRRTMLKLASSVVAIVLFLLLIIKGDLVVSASMVIEGVHTYTHTAPMDSYLSEVYVRPGDEVKKGSILGRLDATEINLEIAALEAERDIYESQANQYLQEGKDAESTISKQEAARTKANLRWAQERLAMTELRSNVEGFLISEDMLPRLGQPVRRGQELFEITDTASLRIVAHVSEEDITDIASALAESIKLHGDNKGVQGKFTLTAYPNMQISFYVERIHPYSTVVENINGFEVRGKITEIPKGLVLRPGMEGHAKIVAGSEPWLVLLFHKLVNKIRLLWWHWI